MASQYNTSILAQPLFKKQLLNKALQANPYRAIYNSARMPNVNENEDLTDTIITILNTQ